MSDADKNKKTIEKGNNNNNGSSDNVFAVLTDMFGAQLTSEVVHNVCLKFNWDLEDCIEHLIGEQMNSTKEFNNQLTSITNDEYDMDIIVESEEVQCSDTSNRLINLEQQICNIEKDSQNTLNNHRQLTYSGAIRKVNRQINNSVDVADGSTNSSQPVHLNVKSTRFHDRPHIQKIVNQINEGFKVMVIMRGAPGCGKSYLAREIIDATTCDDYWNHIFSSDDFFYDKRGRYNFISFRISEAHDWNKCRVDRFAREGWSPIIVDNTNIKLWEMYNYLEMAVKYGYIVQLVEPNTPWSRSAGELAIKNSHNVPKESIERMLSNYELATVKHVIESIGLQPIISPQYRSLPPLPRTESIEKVSQHYIQPPKSQRSFKRSLKPNNLELSTQIPDVAQNESLEETWLQIQKSSLDWTAFEEERNQFWNATPSSISLVESKPMPQRQPEQKTKVVGPSINTNDQGQLNLFALLKEETKNVAAKPSTDDDNNEAQSPSNENESNVLYKHRKHCKNENNSFAQIRQIYPSVPVDFLWDLFEKCEGNGDWTMDILLKDETRIGDYENLDSDEDRARDDFYCNCDQIDSEILNQERVSPYLNSNFIDPSNVVKNPIIATTQRSRRNIISNEEQLVAKRMIEEHFKIGDEHYSEHTKKIRNLRRGVNADATATNVASLPNDDQNGACAIDIDESEQDDKEILEINLGLDLVCQLDTVFGVEAYQRDNIKDIKTNVFMPKSLAQQLYALWIESLHNQLEEQRQKSIKEDAEFARQLHSQQKYPGLHKYSKPPTDLKDMIEMEIAWAAYKAEIDHLKTRTPQDLATQMTHDKLCEIFPNIDRDTLIEILAAHDNKFAQTVDVLKNTLKDNDMDKIENEGRQLCEQARAEVETSKTTNFHLMRSPSATSVRSLEIKKLGPEEAKRLALKEFEDSRNSAMHHTQLKAECYTKAKDAIQRSDTSVALYYSHVANLHKDKIDMYNHKAANCIMEVHNLTQNNPDMLDLHYLHVNEAVECLDIFLDKHITKLKTMPQVYKYVYVITGRGLHSANGISTIKQKVKNRFKERHLPWSEVNPGLLKVKIYKNSRVTVHM